MWDAIIEVFRRDPAPTVLVALIVAGTVFSFIASLFSRWLKYLEIQSGKRVIVQQCSNCDTLRARIRELEEDKDEG